MTIKNLFRFARLAPARIRRPARPAAPLSLEGLEERRLLAADMPMPTDGSQPLATDSHAGHAMDLSQAPVTIMPLGASRVAGGRPAFESYRYELWNDLTARGWAVDFIGTQSDDAAYPELASHSFDTDHEGRSGWTSGDILADLGGWLAETGSPDIVLVSSPGGNDLLEGLDYGQTLANINGIIDLLQQDNPGVTVIVKNLSVLDYLGRPIDVPGTLRSSTDGLRYYFSPSFHYGTGPYVIEVTTTFDIRDLAGNPLGNPATMLFTTEFNPDVNTIAVLSEPFDTNNFEDPPNTNAEWNTTREGWLVGGDITTTIVTPFDNAYAHDFMNEWHGGGRCWDDQLLTSFPVADWSDDGHVFDPGARPLEVIHTPGHTTDSLAVWDETLGWLFTGWTLYPSETIDVATGDSDFDA